MPKEQFFKLKPEKKEKIILAARDEFSIKSYEEVSINEIVSRSNISRGSFYLYFEDKWDIYSHLLKCSFNKIMERVNNTINRGSNIFFAILDIYDYLVIESNLDITIGFITNILKNVNPLIYAKIHEYLNNNTNEEFMKNISFKKEDYTISTAIEYHSLKQLLMNSLLNALINVLVNKKDAHEVREELRISLNIIKYGCYR